LSNSRSGLGNGDTIEITTSKNAVPNKDWLQFVQSNRAKQRIRSYIKNQERKKAEAIGIELLSKDLRKVRKNFNKLEKSGKISEIANNLGFKLQEDMYAAISYGKLSTTRILAKVLPDENNIEAKLNKKETPLRRIFQRAAKATRQKVGVSVSGINNMVIRFGRCCEPLPGDRIVGFISRGRGITVHLADCQQIHGMDQRRFVDVNWDSSNQQLRRVKIIVHCQDQKGILVKITQGVSDNGGDIKNAEINTTQFGKAKISLELELNDSMQFKNVVRAIEMVAGVIKVERVHDA
jgi:GTP pyrophosphokinase